MKADNSLIAEPKPWKKSVLGFFASSFCVS